MWATESERDPVLSCPFMSLLLRRVVSSCASSLNWIEVWIFARLNLIEVKLSLIKVSVLTASFTLSVNFELKHLKCRLLWSFEREHHWRGLPDTSVLGADIVLKLFIFVDCYAKEANARCIAAGRTGDTVVLRFTSPTTRRSTSVWRMRLANNGRFPSSRLPCIRACGIQSLHDANIFCRWSQSDTAEGLPRLAVPVYSVCGIDSILDDRSFHRCLQCFWRRLCKLWLVRACCMRFRCFNFRSTRHPHRCQRHGSRRRDGRPAPTSAVVTFPTFVEIFAEGTLPCFHLSWCRAEFWSRPFQLSSLQASATRGTGRCGHRPRSIIACTIGTLFERE